jgi:cell division protein ZapA
VKQIDVSILGQPYVLGCPEGGEARLREAVARVDAEMAAIRDAGKVRSRDRIAVLAALNIAYAAPTSAPASPASAADPVAAQVDIDGLIQRIDAVLGDDGQLL